MTAPGGGYLSDHGGYLSDSASFLADDGPYPEYGSSGYGYPLYSYPGRYGLAVPPRFVALDRDAPHRVMIGRAERSRRHAGATMRRAARLGVHGRPATHRSEPR
jgi:hypothetical protein